MKTYTHPTIGKFKLDEYGYFFCPLKHARKSYRLVLDICVEDSDEWEDELAKPAGVAERHFEGIDEIIDNAKTIASTKLLSITNAAREAEDLTIIKSEILLKKLDLIDVVVGADEIFVNLSCSAFEDEHGMFTISFGPRGGFKSASCQ